MVPRQPQEPRGPQGAQKTPPRHPQDTPKSAQEPPKTSQGVPRRPQVSSKTLSKIIPKFNRKLQPLKTNFYKQIPQNPTPNPSQNGPQIYWKMHAKIGKQNMYNKCKKKSFMSSLLLTNLCFTRVKRTFAKITRNATHVNDTPKNHPKIIEKKH